MSLLAALGIGVFCYFAVGFLTGHAPRLHRVRRPRPGVPPDRRKEAVHDYRWASGRDSLLEEDRDCR